MGKKSKQKKNRQNSQTTKQMPVKTMRQPENVLTGGNVHALAQAAAKPSMHFDDTSYIRKDIVRILITLSVLIVILASGVLLNSKTTYLHQAGTQLSTFLRLSN